MREAASDLDRLRHDGPDSSLMAAVASCVRDLTSGSSGSGVSDRVLRTASGALRAARCVFVPEAPLAELADEAADGAPYVVTYQSNASRSAGSSTLVVPVRLGDRALGALHARRDSGAAPFTEGDVAAAAIFADLAALAVAGECSQSGPGPAALRPSCILLADRSGRIVDLADDESVLGVDAAVLVGQSVTDVLRLRSRGQLPWPPPVGLTFQEGLLCLAGGREDLIDFRPTALADSAGYVFVCRPVAGHEPAANAAMLRRELAAWRAITDKLLVSASLGEAVDEVLAVVVELTSLPSAVIYLYDDTSRELRVAAYRGMSPEFAAAVDRVKPGEGFSGRVFLNAEPIVVQDVSHDWRLSRGVVRELDLRSYACFPLLGHGRVLGTLGIIGPDTRAFNRDETEFLSGIGRQIGFLLEMAERAYGPWSKARLLGPAPSAKRQLSDRERTVLRQLAGGLAPKQIALRLGISEKTVRNHISSMYAKLPVSDRGQLVLWAATQGLVPFQSMSGSPDGRPDDDAEPMAAMSPGLRS
jgi:GAF domain-containing protein